MIASEEDKAITCVTEPAYLAKLKETLNQGANSATKLIRKVTAVASTRPVPTGVMGGPGKLAIVIKHLASRTLDQLLAS